MTSLEQYYGREPELRAKTFPLYEELLPQRAVDFINTSPMVNALLRYVSRPGLDDYDVSKIDGALIPREAQSSGLQAWLHQNPSVQDGVNKLAIAAGFIGPKAKLPTIDGRTRNMIYANHLRRMPVDESAAALNVSPQDIDAVLQEFMAAKVQRSMRQDDHRAAAREAAELRRRMEAAETLPEPQRRMVEQDDLAARARRRIDIEAARQARIQNARIENTQPTTLAPPLSSETQTKLDEQMRAIAATIRPERRFDIMGRVRNETRGAVDADRLEYDALRQGLVDRGALDGPVKRAIDARQARIDSIAPPEPTQDAALLERWRAKGLLGARGASAPKIAADEWSATPSQGRSAEYRRQYQADRYRNDPSYRQKLRENDQRNRDTARARRSYIDGDEPW